MKKKNQKNKSYFEQYDKTVVYFLWDKNSQRYFKGVSLCQPDDPFDLTKGIEIARAKAVVKMRNSLCKAIQVRLDMIQQLKEYEPELLKQAEYWNAKAVDSQNKLNKILDNLK